MMQKTGGKVLLVTGSSRGIGASTVIEGARQGYAVCINYLHNKQAAKGISHEIEKLGGTCITVMADVSKESEVVRLFQEVDTCLGPISALVNNVGILQEKIKLVDMTAERINQMLTTNVTSYFLCCREAVRRMSISSGGAGGCIVNVSSAAARLGAAGEYIDYAASKGAVDTLTIGLSKEVAADGIRVNCVRPGFIFTDIHADSGDPDRVNKIASSLPMRRGGKPEEVTDAIMWLLSEKSSYVTGSFIDVAGGR